MLGIVALVDSLSDGIIVKRLWTFVSNMIGYGAYELLVTWVIKYLVFACAVISTIKLIRTVRQNTILRQTMTMKDQQIMDNYHAIERNIRDTAALRHDWKNQITSLNLLFQEGNLDRLGERLGQLSAEVDRLRLPAYSDCFIVNALLQNASVRAAGENISFRAQAPLPKRLEIDEGDLCSLLMNLLDNAFEAAAKVEEKDRRFVDITLRINQGFLAVCCRNSFKGEVEVGRDGMPETTKEDRSGHGFGMRQMELIAGKYGSKLDLSQDNGVFTVQTALKLKNKKTPQKSGALKSPDRV